MSRAEPGPDPVSPVEQVLVVVPAKDEEQLLPACLASLDRAAAAVDVPVQVVVAADGTDRTLALAQGHPGVLGVPHRGVVGEARHAGVLAGWRAVGTHRPSLSPRATWLASTDADSQVPADWLVHHLELAAAGAELVLGMVDVAAADVDPVAAAWREAYRAALCPGPCHPHVHGANLGVRLSAYLAAGGFPAVAAHEDLLLAEAVLAGSVDRCVRTRRAPVITSDRRTGRAPAGVAADLRRLATDLDAVRNS